MQRHSSKKHPFKNGAATRARNPRDSGHADQRKRRTKVTAGCLFSAIGGFAAAFEQAGAKVAWANEKDPFAVTTFRHNFPHINCIGKPIEELTVAGDELCPVDVLTAGFPCQPFSVAGMKRGFHDERGIVFLEMIRLLKKFGAERPKILLLENVANFRSHDEGRTFRRVQREIQQMEDRGVFRKIGPGYVQSKSSSPVSFKYSNVES